MDWSHGKACPGCRRSDWRKSGGGMFLDLLPNKGIRFCGYCGFYIVPQDFDGLGETRWSKKTTAEATVA